MNHNNVEANVESADAASLRRKYSLTNQEIIKQNIKLQQQMRKMQQSYHELVSENVSLRHECNQLALERDQLLKYIQTIKKEVNDRTPTLALIAEHLGDLVAFLKNLTASPATVEEDTADDSSSANDLKSFSGLRSQNGAYFAKFAAKKALTGRLGAIPEDADESSQGQNKEHDK